MLTKTDIEKYFMAEKQESLLFLGIGIAAIVVALLGVFVWKTQFWKGASIPLILIAVLQIIVGFTVYNRSDADRIRVVYALTMNPNDLKEKELPRMETVNKNFVIYRYVETALLLVGIALIAMYKNNTEKQFIYGIAVALAIQAALMLGADYFAEKRALIYTAQLKEVIK
ncbi:MAG: hypothetical protein MUE72_00865 [Chitinophagaceae bacterium]|jgi:drug/metabolite transporter (DMT)-like permease|nr:hypothetical protein [Chitinophagaceae bacterium]